MNDALRPPTLPPRRVAVATMLIFAGAILALALTHVARRHEVVRLSYELSRETEALQTQQREHQRLKAERSWLRHPDRIERFARDLGMSRPAPGQVRVIHTASDQLANARGSSRQ